MLKKSGNFPGSPPSTLYAHRSLVCREQTCQRANAPNWDRGGSQLYEVKLTPYGLVESSDTAALVMFVFPSFSQVSYSRASSKHLEVFWGPRHLHFLAGLAYDWNALFFDLFKTFSILPHMTILNRPPMRLARPPARSLSKRPHLRLPRHQAQSLILKVTPPVVTSANLTLMSSMFEKEHHETRSWRKRGCLFGQELGAP